MFKALITAAMLAWMASASAYSDSSDQPPPPPSPTRGAPELIAWYRAHARDLPWRRAEYLAEYGAWGVLVSEFMLQQTPVTRVIPHLQAWLARWPDPAALASATGAEVLQQWANLGYPRRALWLHRAAIAIRASRRWTGRGSGCPRAAGRP